MAVIGRHSIGQMLIQAGKIDNKQLQTALNMQKEEDAYLGSIFKKPHLAATWRHHVSGATVRRLGSQMAKFCLHCERLTGQVTKRGFSSHLGATNASPGRQKWGFRCDVHGVMILPLW